MDGQGPEHSQARIERFLQLSDDNCDEDQSIAFQDQLRLGNIQIISCSTSANYFHALRRQLHRDYRKPLITFNSKKLLKFRGVILHLFRLTDQLRTSLKVQISRQFTQIMM
jgi:2-oxoglutarate dehydrogenase E1 component